MTHPSIHAKTHPDKIAYRMAGSGQALTYDDIMARLERDLSGSEPANGTCDWYRSTLLFPSMVGEKRGGACTIR